LIARDRGAALRTDSVPDIPALGQSCLWLVKGWAPLHMVSGFFALAMLEGRRKRAGLTAGSDMIAP